MAVTYRGLLYFCAEFRVSYVPRQECVFDMSSCVLVDCVLPVSPGQNVTFDEWAEDK